MAFLASKMRSSKVPLLPEALPVLPPPLPAARHPNLTIFRLGLPGLELRTAEQIPRPLPTRGGWLYFRINTNSPAWQSIQVNQAMGIRLRDTLITNPEQLPGDRRVEVVFEGRKSAIEFAIFAVPTL